MELNYLITDVDNTIADPTERIRCALRDLGREDVFAKTAEEFGGFARYLSEGEMSKFWRLFLSDKYLNLDEPAPGAADFLQNVKARGVGLAYLTGRHDEPGDSMRQGTVEWLNRHGFPDPGESGVDLYMKPKRKANDRDFKRELLDRQFSGKPDGSTGIGVGDHPDDAAVYYEVGLAPVVMNWLGLFPVEDLRSAAPEVEIFDDWFDVRRVFLEEMTSNS